MLTWHRKGTWKKISKADNKLIVEITYTEGAPANKTKDTMEITFRSQSNIETKVGGEEVDWRRDKWIRGAPKVKS